MGWLANLWGTKKEKSNIIPLDLAWLKTDMHNHFLPNVDDGSRSMDESLALLLKMQEFGYQKCIITPHIKMDSFPNTEEHLTHEFKILQDTLSGVGLQLQLELGAEYYLDDNFVNKIDQGKLLSFGSKNYVLVEFSFTHAPVFEAEAFQRMIAQGYTPILAHFERYIYFHGNVEAAEKYRSMGVNIQLNINSLTGHYGPEVRKQAERMLDHFAVDFIGTDAHRMEHLLQLEEHLTSPYIRELGQRLFKNQGL